MAEKIERAFLHNGINEALLKPLATYIFSASQEEREYLEKVFSDNELMYKFYVEKGSYQLYFPAIISGKKLSCIFPRANAMVAMVPE